MAERLGDWSHIPTVKGSNPGWVEVFAHVYLFTFNHVSSWDATKRRNSRVSMVKRLGGWSRIPTFKGSRPA